MIGQRRHRSLTGSFSPDAFAALDDVELVRYPSIPRNRLPRLSAWLHDRAVTMSLTVLCRAKRPDLIHAHTEGEAPAAVGVGKKLGIPVVVTLHGINLAPRYFASSFLRERFRSSLKAADRVVLVGEPLENYFAALLGGTENLSIIPNGFIPPSGTPIVPFSRGSELRFISLSNLHQGKGVDVALHALAKARAGGLGMFSYTIVGDGYERDGLEALAASLGLTDRVRFIGACPHTQVYGLLEQADIFLLPSYREAFGVAYLEAMAAGLLAIGVQGEGPSAFIRDGETGILVPPQDSDNLAKRLIEIASEPAKMQRVAAAGTVHIRNNLTWEHHAKKLAALYHDVLRQ
jgi:glycosyltransferase involved in cell wall biosynthesis